MRPRRPPVDLTQQQGNSSSYINDHYKELMDLAEQDPDACAQHILDAIGAMVGHGISEANFRKLRTELTRVAPLGTAKLQQYLTNYMLAGAGMRAEDNEMAAMASLISEDNEPIELTEHQLRLVKMVGEYGFFAVPISR